MLLAIDVGNTQTHLGVFDDGRLIDHWRFATDGRDTADELAVRISGLLGLRGLGFSGVTAMTMASVVPRASAEYQRFCSRYLGVECLSISSETETGMPIRLDNPHELGADRLVNAVAAHATYGGPCAVVDFGTAITVDAISARGEYLGGVISPGVQISMEALARRAARLPMVEFAEPERAIGTTTEAGLQAGMVFGFAGAIDAIAGRVDAELGGGTRFVATGGMSGQIVPHCRMIDEYDELLTLSGLRLLYGRNC